MRATIKRQIKQMDPEQAKLRWPRSFFVLTNQEHRKRKNWLRKGRYDLLKRKT